MKNNLLRGELSCSFYLYRFCKYVSYGFPIINFCNPGVYYETPCVYIHTHMYVQYIIWIAYMYVCTMYILKILNTYCLSSAAIVMPLHLSIMLHVYTLFVFLLSLVFMCRTMQDTGHSHHSFGKLKQHNLNVSNLLLTNQTMDSIV